MKIICENCGCEQVELRFDGLDGKKAIIWAYCLECSYGKEIEIESVYEEKD